MDRSVVWISPIRNADVYVDYNNQGTNYEKHYIEQLQSKKFTDSDHDMSVCSSLVLLLCPHIKTFGRELSFLQLNQTQDQTATLCQLLQHGDRYDTKVNCKSWCSLQHRIHRSQRNASQSVWIWELRFHRCKKSVQQKLLIFPLLTRGTC